VDHVTGVFAKGYLGGIDLLGSHMNDEDFPPLIFSFSNTVSSTKTGRDSTPTPTSDMLSFAVMAVGSTGSSAIITIRSA
jgi:hypothetical protein